MPAVMPTGVEHLAAAERIERAFGVMPAVMPTGVEHLFPDPGRPHTITVMPAVMPTGVEHSRVVAGALPHVRECDARRDADRR